jgi:hypothetical protein
MRTVVPLFVLSMLITIVIGNAPVAQAQNEVDLVRNAKFTIVNPTKNKLSYAVRWGNGKWDETIIKPNESFTHWYPKHNEHPGVQIRFSRIVNPIDDVPMKTYRLEPRWVAERNGKGVEGTPKVYRFNVKDSKVDLTGHR